MICLENSTADKTLSDLWGFSEIDARLRDILLAADAILHQYDAHVIITSAYRPDPSSVHGHWRAVDIRTKHLNDLTAYELEDRLNKLFPRTDGKPTALFHDVGLGAHIHLQVPGPRQDASAEIDWERAYI